ncbi:ComF family protein [Pseudoroseicyclus aestuarii]|nr:double zinc ribbon domain-containing protein [Pseudoroseicyclus aestuarii]
MESAVRLIYPPRCVLCGDLTEADFALCPLCWGETRFAAGLCCDQCGAPLPGEGDGSERCDDCLVLARPWGRGRSALVYAGGGRRMVLALKHGDRTDLVRTLGGWMARAGRGILGPDVLLVPVPLHPLRLLRRRYNQAALLAGAAARAVGAAHCPDALIRLRATRPLDGHGREARFAALDGAIAPHPRRGALMRGRSVVIVDDVMTSGATLAASAEAARRAGAARIDVLTLARVVKDA